MTGHPFNPSHSHCVTTAPLLVSKFYCKVDPIAFLNLIFFIVDNSKTILGKMLSASFQGISPEKIRNGVEKEVGNGLMNGSLKTPIVKPGVNRSLMKPVNGSLESPPVNPLSELVEEMLEG